MHDDLDLRVIERHHDADPRYRAELRQRVAAILDGAETLPTDDLAAEEIAIDFAAPRPTRREPRRRWALGAAALLSAAAAIAGIAVLTADDDAPTEPVDSVSVPPSTVAPAPTTALSALPTSGGMWPQSNLDEVRAAQELADAGDPAFTWQVATQPLTDDPDVHLKLEVVDRFIHEVLGWEAYQFNAYQSWDSNASGAGDGWADGALTNQHYIRCAPGRTNPLYPSESCAPTLGDLEYESVRLDLAQPIRRGDGGILVVSQWWTGSFWQVDPKALEAEARGRLEQFLAARVAGSGAEEYTQVISYAEVPLLYATTSDAEYERYEIELTDGPKWPHGFMSLSARLFADGGATVVEQDLHWQPGEGLWLDPYSTTENGEPIVLSHTSPEGAVTVSVPSTWSMFYSDRAAGVGPTDPFVWYGLISEHPPSPSNWESPKLIGLVDPVGYDAWCAANGGSPFLTAPADAATIAQRLVTDPNFVTTSPAAASIGGVDALSIDMTLAPGGKRCEVAITDISRWVHELRPGLRIRLYLLDLPEGMPVETLAITVVAPEDEFEAFVAEIAPIIDSIEFQPG